MLVGALLGGWFCASLIHQFRFKWWSRSAVFDRLNFLPNWSFFAPNPGRQDLHFLYREWQGEQPGSWLEPFTYAGDRRWRWLWNPGRYPSKALSDLAQGLLLNAASTSSTENPKWILISGYYLSLLALVMAQPPIASGADQRQFAIAATQGFGAGRKLELKFLSERHRVAD